MKTSGGLLLGEVRSAPKTSRAVVGWSGEHLRLDAFWQLFRVKRAIRREIYRTGRRLRIALPWPRVVFSRSSPHMYDCLISRDWLGYKIDFLGADPTDLSNLIHRTANFL